VPEELGGPRSGLPSRRIEGPLIVLGIDPGTAVTGYGVVARERTAP
jgi:hypothetical protein